MIKIFSYLSRKKNKFTKTNPLKNTNTINIIKWSTWLLLILTLAIFNIAPLFAQGTANAETGETITSIINKEAFRTNNLWILIATFLVFIMHLGFACLESGLTRGKNTVNILFKNISILSIGILTYALCGFNLMYPGSNWNFYGWLGFAGFGLTLPAGDAGLANYANGTYAYYTDFIFQAMFAATTATIVSGAVAERIKLSSFLLFSAILVGVIYPIAGSWKWGGGWLDRLGFYDFAGSTLVHSVGGWAALAAVLLLGPRLGKYGQDKSVRAIFGDNLPLAAIGMFLLWFGWYGFNVGSVLSANPAAMALVTVTTSLAAAAGIATSIITSKIVQKNYDLTMVLNGALAGLVGITAGANVVTPLSATIIGGVAGALVVLAVILIDSKLRLDDPVGAISVHLVCGIWGTLAVGIFSTNPNNSFIAQFIGVVSYAIIAFLGSSIVLTIINAFMGLRVSAKEERQGLDLAEHKMSAYHSFQMFTNN